MDIDKALAEFDILPLITVWLLARLQPAR